MADVQNQAPPPNLPPPKPIRTVKYALIAVMCLLAVLAVASVINTMRLPAAQKVGEKPQVGDPSMLTAFDFKNAEAARRLAEKNSESNATADDVKPLTSDQNKALGIADTGTRDAKQEALRRRQEREKQRRDALRSTSVLVDFADKETVSVAPRASGPPRPETASRADDQRAENAPGENRAIVDEKKDLAPWDAYTGKLYRLFEGRDTIEAILMNRINGSANGPIMAQVSLDIYSHDHQKLLIPQGTVVTGEVTAVNSTQQQRLFVAFHRMIMPDGFSVSLDKFTGLNQAGEVGLRDKVNHHYLSIFGASLAIGAIGGLAQIGNGTSGFGYDPGVEFRNGVSQRTGEEAMQVLNRFLNQLPTFTVRERSRLRIWLTNDLLLPAADNHTMPGDI